MNEFLKTLLSLSLSGTLLFLLVLLPKGLYRERFSRRWQYYIWLVVALRFLLPFAPGVTFTGYLFHRVEAALPAAEYSAVPGESGGQPGYAGGTSSRQTDFAGAALQETVSSDSHTLGDKDGGSRIDATNRRPGSQNTGTGLTALIVRLRNLPYLPTAAFFLWLLTATALLIRKATAYQSFLNFLKAASQEVSDIEALNLLSDCKERLHIRGKVELYTNPLIASPILTGFFRPRIILPCRRGPEPDRSATAALQRQTAPGMPGIRKKDLPYIFTHELIHHRRRDMFYKWFLQLVLCVHWFNPFVYLLVREAGRACELACDESVVASLDDAGKKAYGNTLLASLQTPNPYKSPQPSVTLAESAKELKERLGAIMKSHKKTKSITLLTVLATAAVCVAFGTLGAYAKSDRDNPAKAASAPEHAGSADSPDDPGTPSPLPEGVSYEQEGNIYYIYTEGTDSGDRPTVGFTDGTIGVVLVGRDNYISLGPFDQSADAEDFLAEVNRICRDMADSKRITQKDAQVILELAEIIKDNLPNLTSSRNTTAGYTFVQRGYYQDSFIIELGWNLPAGGQVISQAKRITATLKDGSRLSVYFADTAREYAHDSEALAAIGNLIDSLREKNLKGYPDLETPLVSRIRKVDGSDLPALAKEYIADEDLSGFSAVFPVLDAASQEECCRILYEEYNTSFFVSIVPFLEEDMLLSFLEQADEDGNVSFFFALLLSGYVPTEQISENYAEKYYENDNIASFTAIVSFLPEEDQRRFLERAERDYKPAFYQAIIGAMSQSLR